MKLIQAKSLLAKKLKGKNMSNLRTVKYFATNNTQNSQNISMEISNATAIQGKVTIPPDDFPMNIPSNGGTKEVDFKANDSRGSVQCQTRTVIQNKDALTVQMLNESGNVTTSFSIANSPHTYHLGPNGNSTFIYEGLQWTFQTSSVNLEYTVQVSITKP